MRPETRLNAISNFIQTKRNRFAVITFHEIFIVHNVLESKTVN